MNTRPGRQARNFLSTIDKRVPYEVHYRNAIYDADLYRWGIDTLSEVFKGLKDIYKEETVAVNK